MITKQTKLGRKLVYLVKSNMTFYKNKKNLMASLSIAILLLFTNLLPANSWVIPTTTNQSGASGYGGAGDDQGNAIIEVRGYLYSTGTFSGISNFDSTGILSLTSNGGKDIYISKVNASTGDFVWIKGIGGVLDDQGLSITGFDMAPISDDLYITGNFEGTVDFDPGVGVANLTSAGGTDIFILNLDTNGNFKWVKRLWGSANSQATSITLTTSTNNSTVANIYITGSFEGKVDFNPNNGTYYLTSAGRDDLFVLNLTKVGNFVWAKRIGSSGQDRAYSIANHGSTDDFLNITGTFEATVDFNPATAVANLTADNNGDTFILKLSSAGVYLWSKKLGGMTTPLGSSGGPRFIFNKCDTAAVKGTYLVGSFEGREDFDPHLINVLKLTSLGGKDVFIAKLTSSGSLLWAKSFGGIGNDEGQALSFGEDCLFPVIYLTGSFEDKVDFDPGVNIVNLTSNGGSDIFVSKFDINGQHQWVRYWGGPNEDVGYAVANRGSNMLLTGRFQSTANFQLNGPPATLTSAGGSDIFISSLNQSGN